MAYSKENLESSDDKASPCFRLVFLNRRAAARYRALGSVIANSFKCNFIFVNMPHRIHKCTNTLYDYAIINY
jgi:hypothetical protein